MNRSLRATSSSKDEIVFRFHCNHAHFTKSVTFVWPRKKPQMSWSSSSSASRTSSSSAFVVICLLHSLSALGSGALMMLDMKEVYTFKHDVETATKLLGSTPHDQLLIRTSDSFSGLLPFAIGFFLFMVSFVRDKDFQSFFAKGCTVLHVFMAIWRFWFERSVEDLAWDWPRQTVGDILLALSWVFVLVYSWREKYD